ncbi:MAG: GerMN domain-containing protein [Acidimicrobiales bacterium]
MVLGPLVLLLSACGLGADPSPTIVNSHDVPYKLLAPATTTTQVGPQREYVTIYLDGPQHLVPFSTALPPPVTVRKVLAALDKGPTSTQAAQGLKSPISTAAPLSLASDAGGTVTVDVGSGFTALAEQDQAIAAAQLVYTLTALPHVTSVVIRIDGKHAKVPTGTGTLSGQPLTRADYASLAPI